MKESRWLRWLGPGVIAASAAGLIASNALGAGQRPWVAKACSDESGARVAAARETGPTDLGDLRLEPWFRLDPRLDGSGALEGQHLAVGVDGDRSSRFLDLPAESFAAGPFGRIVLVGTDDGTISRLEAMDVAAQCSWAVDLDPSVIRRGTIDPAGETIYEMRVDRATRADLGIWARPLSGNLPAVRVIEPIQDDERFGRTWTTEFAWDLSGRTLAVQSCGESACRTQIIDPAGGLLRAVAEPDLGSMVGLDGDVLVTYAACPGLPCPILATDLVSGTRRVLSDAGAAAVAITTPDGPRLVHEVLGEAGVALRSVAFDGSSVTDLGRLPDGRRLNPTRPASDASTRVPTGWVVLSPGGSLPGSGPSAQTQLRHIPDGTTVQLDEVAR